MREIDTGVIKAEENKGGRQKSYKKGRIGNWNVYKVPKQTPSRHSDGRSQFFDMISNPFGPPAFLQFTCTLRKIWNTGNRLKVFS